MTRPYPASIIREQAAKIKGEQDRYNFIMQKLAEWQKCLDHSRVELKRTIRDADKHGQPEHTHIGLNSAYLSNLAEVAEVQDLLDYCKYTYTPSVPHYSNEGINGEVRFRRMFYADNGEFSHFVCEHRNTVWCSHNIEHLDTGWQEQPGIQATYLMKCLNQMCEIFIDQ